MTSIPHFRVTDQLQESVSFRGLKPLRVRTCQRCQNCIDLPVKVIIESSPNWGGEPTCALIQKYLLGCIRDGVADTEEIQGRYEAAESLHVWFRHLVGMEGTSAVLSRASSAITNLYLESGEEVRDAIETGFLEHVLETAALRPYFEHWAFDPRLQLAWSRALEWGKHTPIIWQDFSTTPTERQRVMDCSPHFRQVLVNALTV